MIEKVLSPLDEEDDIEQQFETGDDEYSELHFDLLSEHMDEGKIYESIAEELGDYEAVAAEDTEDE